MTKTPEQWLEEASPKKEHGIFKLFLGYAPGVGKTYNMLSEGIRRKSRGEDVVLGLVETHGRKGVAELASRLESVPRKAMEYKGASFDEMDVDAILARKPQVVLIDELAHTNVEGSKHIKRYEDVIELIDAKIDVLAGLVRKAAANSGNVTDATWKAAQKGGWSDEQLTDAFAYLGATVFTGYFLNYAQTDLDV